ncbi:MAG: hypothetical protein ACJARO_001560, partial [Bacteriovoracaceae bacterium]
ATDQANAYEEKEGILKNHLCTHRLKLK